MKKRFYQFGLYIVLILLLSSLAAGCTAKEPDPSAAASDPAATTDTQAATQATTQTATQATTEAATQATEAATQATEAGSTEPTMPPVNDPYPQYVQTDIQKIITNSDIHRNEWKICISVPKIEPFSEDAIACQQEIQDIFLPKIAEIQDYSDQGYWPLTASIQFETYLNGDILSLVVQEATNIDINLYWVYNFDVVSGKRLDTDALMAKLQITDYAQRVTQTARTAFETKWSSPQAQELELYKERWEATVSEENINAAQPFLGNDGQLTVAIFIGSLAGASGYYYLIPVA